MRELIERLMAEETDAKRAQASAYKTAISRSSLSVPMKFLKAKGLLKGRILDYGCGKGSDADFLANDAEVSKFDPHFFPGKPKGKFDTITCDYVLNTISDADGKKVISKIKSLLAPGGKAYVAVRRDKFKEGFSSKGTFQRIVKLKYPVLVDNSSMALYVVK